MIKFTKKERAIRKKTFEYMRKYKPTKKKNNIKVTTTFGIGKTKRRIFMATGFKNITEAKKYLKKIQTKTGKIQMKRMGYSNPRIKKR